MPPFGAIRDASGTAPKYVPAAIVRPLFQCFGVAQQTRDRYRFGAMTRDEFVANYERQLDRLPDDIVRLASVASAAPTALLCVEHDAGCCHRSVLAARLAAEADVYEVRHL